MAVTRSGDYGFLDKIRINEGNEKCRAVFGEICESDKRRAVMLLGDRQMTFPCLYILLPQIRAYGLERYLNPRAAMARRIVESIGRRNASGSGDGLSERSDAVYPVLKWMLDTGQAEDGMNDDFEEILETVVSVLINTYKDTRTVPAALDLAFSRNRMGHNIHQLVWSAFRIHDPQTLKLVAQRIRSTEEQDVRLACSLLGIPSAGGDEAEDNQKRYDAYMQWLNENDPFLYFTGESMQMTSQPVFCRVDLERKYVHRETPSYDQQPITPADDMESQSLAAFNTLSEDEKALLSEYSHQAHQANPAEWKRWLQRPINEQIKTAQLEREGFHDHDNGQYV